MKTIIKLLVAALVINAVFQASRSAFRHYQFEDEARQAALFGTQLSEDEVEQRIMVIAEGAGVPIAADDLTVTRDNFKTTIEGTYIDEISLVPGVWVYPQTWDFSLELLNITAR